MSRYWYRDRGRGKLHLFSSSRERSFCGRLLRCHLTAEERRYSASNDQGWFCSDYCVGCMKARQKDWDTAFGSKRRKLIHVDQQTIKRNRENGSHDPPITVKIPSLGINLRASDVRIEGLTRLVYRPDDPLDCGARLWIETEGRVALELGPGDWVRPVTSGS